MTDNSKLNYVTSQISDILVGNFASQSPANSRKNTNATLYKDFNTDVDNIMNLFP